VLRVKFPLTEVEFVHEEQCKFIRIWSVASCFALVIPSNFL